VPEPEIEKAEKIIKDTPIPSPSPTPEAQVEPLKEHGWCVRGAMWVGHYYPWKTTLAAVVIFAACMGYGWIQSNMFRIKACWRIFKQLANDRNLTRLPPVGVPNGGQTDAQMIMIRIQNTEAALHQQNVTILGRINEIARDIRGLDNRLNAVQTALQDVQRNAGAVATTLAQGISHATVTTSHVGLVTIDIRQRMGIYWSMFLSMWRQAGFQVPIVIQDNQVQNTNGGNGQQ
jgi:hypothetical protein